MDRPVCSRIEGMLPEYLDEVLGVTDSEAVRRHLAQCEACRREAEKWAALDRVLAAGLALEEPVSDDEIEAAVARVREVRPAWRAAPAPLRFWRTWAPSFALTAAAGILLAIFGLLPDSAVAEARQYVSDRAASFIWAGPTEVAGLLPSDLNAIRARVEALPAETADGVAQGWTQGLEWTRDLGARVGMIPLMVAAIVLLAANVIFARNVRGALRAVPGG